MTKNQDILNSVCDYFKISVSDLFDREKTKERVLKRQIFTFLLLTDSVGTLNNHVEFILKTSGERFTHATLIYSRDKIHSNKQHYSDIAKYISEIRKLYPQKGYEHLKFQNSTCKNLNISYSINNTV